MGFYFIVTGKNLCLHLLSISKRGQLGHKLILFCLPIRHWVKEQWLRNEARFSCMRLLAMLCSPKMFCMFCCKLHPVMFSPIDQLPSTDLLDQLFYVLESEKECHSGSNRCLLSTYLAICYPLTLGAISRSEQMGEENKRRCPPVLEGGNLEVSQNLINIRYATAIMPRNPGSGQQSGARQSLYTSIRHGSKSLAFKVLEKYCWEKCMYDTHILKYECRVANLREDLYAGQNTEALNLQKE